MATRSSSGTSATSSRWSSRSPRRSTPSAASTCASTTPSAINLSRTKAPGVKHFDLMPAWTRGTFVVSRACVPHLGATRTTSSRCRRDQPRRRSARARHTSPTRREVADRHVHASARQAGWEDDGIPIGAVGRAAWIVSTAASNVLGVDEAMTASAQPQLYADAAYAVVDRPSRSHRRHVLLGAPGRERRRLRRLRLRAGSTPQVDLFVGARITTTKENLVAVAPNRRFTSGARRDQLGVSDCVERHAGRSTPSPRQASPVDPHRPRGRLIHRSREQSHTATTLALTRPSRAHSYRSTVRPVRREPPRPARFPAPLPTACGARQLNKSAPWPAHRASP